MSDFSDVGQFHDRFGLDNVTFGGPGPRDVPDDVLHFRKEFMQEELNEFYVGMLERDHAQMADALVDLVYVAMGTAHLLGYPWSAVWDVIQRANMAKVRAESATDVRSKRGHAFDVVKPEGWRPPDVTGVLTEHGWTERMES